MAITSPVTRLQSGLLAMANDTLGNGNEKNGRPDPRSVSKSRQAIS